MFFRKSEVRTDELNEQIKSLERERDSLVDRNQGLKNEMEDLKHKKQRESDEIKHIVKMREESLDIAHKKKELEREKAKERAIAEVKDQYRDKVEAGLEKQLERMQKMYGQVLERLPNVNARLKGEV